MCVSRSSLCYVCKLLIKGHFTTFKVCQIFVYLFPFRISHPGPLCLCEDRTRKLHLGPKFTAVLLVCFGSLFLSDGGNERQKTSGTEVPYAVLDAGQGWFAQGVMAPESGAALIFSASWNTAVYRRRLTRRFVEISVFRAKDSQFTGSIPCLPVAEHSKSNSRECEPATGVMFSASHR